jgi:hypothetical protein
MKILVVMQMAWAAIVLLFSGLQFLTQRHWLSGAIVAVMVVYLYVSLVLLERVRWAWWFCFLPPIASLALYGPMVGYNLWRVSQQDPLFSDSPGTLIVVLFMTFVYVIPPIMLLLRLMIVRSELLPTGSVEQARSSSVG